ncbi:MAG: hypothetical protein JST92_25790, partial [Deltaproteobacteria bacterium]|nr:hypothetical protein [Deltaproteobacteria bacterium]
MQSDVDRCALNAQDKGSSSLQGKVRMQILVRKDGQVYAAFAHSTKGIDDRPMLRCIANNALLWKYQPASTDSWAPFPLAFTTAGQDASGMTSSLGLHAAQTAPQVFLPERHPKVDPADLDEKLAQETLDVLPDVTSAEHGLAMAAVHKVPEAMADFSAALAKDPNDVLALRGKAELIAETHGDLNEAAGLVHRLVEAAPNSMFGPEASIYVCAALKNDLCVVDAWRALTTSAEVHS